MQLFSPEVAGFDFSGPTLEGAEFAEVPHKHVVQGLEVCLYLLVVELFEHVRSLDAVHLLQ